MKKALTKLLRTLGVREVDPFMKVSFEAKRPKFVYLYYWSNVFKDAGRGEDKNLPIFCK
jgi:hypothetical protein